MVASSA